MRLGELILNEMGIGTVTEFRMLKMPSPRRIVVTCILYSQYLFLLVSALFLVEKQVAIDDEGYETPELNDRLYLHFKVTEDFRQHPVLSGCYVCVCRW